jgi:uncharacterized protein (TIGR02679 family)
MTAGAIDLPRLQATLGRPEFARLREALRRRLELGRSLTGTVSLTRAARSERAACDELFGRRSTRGATLVVDLDALARLLAEAGICADLRSGIEALVGPTIDRRVAAAENAAAWQALWQQAHEALAQCSALTAWLDELARDGLVKRLCGSPLAAAPVLRDLMRLVEHLPAAGEPLPTFAARLFGDAHALDSGTPLATLAVRAAARIGGVTFEDDAEGRRSAWASVGVMCDELSTPVLVLNLPTSGENALCQILRAAAVGAEPVHVSLRQLLRYPLSHDGALRERAIFVCENPSIVAMAAMQLGARCAPLVCVNGQFATPSLVLLRQLNIAGAKLRYHGDFDPAGLAIARRVFAECGAQPWRFDEAEYLAAPKGIPFAGQPGVTPWSPGLQGAMFSLRCAVHEEATFESLATDLVASA